MNQVTFEPLIWHADVIYGTKPGKAMRNHGNKKRH